MIDVLDREIALVLVPFGIAAELAAAVSQHAQELDIVLLEERQHTVIEQIGRRDRRLAVVELGKAYLGWSQVELATGRLHVRRAKNGSPSVHPMQGDEIRALRRLQREQGLSSHVFMSERDGPMTPKAFHNCPGWGSFDARTVALSIVGEKAPTGAPQGESAQCAVLWTPNSTLWRANDHTA